MSSMGPPFTVPASAVDALKSRLVTYGLRPDRLPTDQQLADMLADVLRRLDDDVLIRALAARRQ